MKYTDRFFRFPVRLYLTKDLEKGRDDINELEERLGMTFPKDEEAEEEIEPESIIGWEKVFLEDVCGFGTLFSRGKAIVDVKEQGFDCTLVYLKFGKEVGCAWAPELFEQRLNEHAAKLQQIEEDQMNENIKKQAIAIREQLETQLGGSLSITPDKSKKKNSKWRFW